LKRQEPKGGGTAACRLLTIIAGTQPSAFGWLRTRKIQPTKPSSSVRLAQNAQNPADKALLLKMAETWLRLAEQAEGRESKKPD
jgi:hypothetical protein